MKSILIAPKLTNNMIWMTVLIILAVELIPMEKPSNPSFFLLRFLDPVFKDWCNSLQKVGILEKNWFISSKPKCQTVLDYFFGNCIRINNMENDLQSLKNISDLSPFHAFCYTIVRRFLEIVCLYLSRWMSVTSLFLFTLSSSSLLWLLFHKKSLVREPKKKNRTFMSKQLIAVILMLTISSISIISMFLPFALYLATGSVLDNEIARLFDDSDRYLRILYLLKKVLSSRQSCLAVYDLYNFHCLKKTLFDFEASDINRTLSEGIGKVFCMQVQLALINMIAFIALCISYSILILLCYILIQSFVRLFRFRSVKVKKSVTFMRSPKKPFLQPAKKPQLEICQQIFLEPGIMKPWKELSFSSFTPKTLKEKACFDEKTRIIERSLNSDFNRGNRKKKLSEIVEGKQTLPSDYSTSEKAEHSTNTEKNTLPEETLMNRKKSNCRSNTIENASHNRRSPVTQNIQKPEFRDFTKRRLSRRSFSVPVTRNYIKTEEEDNLPLSCIDASTYVRFDSSSDSSGESECSILDHRNDVIHTDLN